ncbi:MAG: hypothetical protein WBQ34_19115 [Candidatus Acidiferrales bacterium]
MATKLKLRVNGAMREIESASDTSYQWGIRGRWHRNYRKQILSAGGAAAATAGAIACAFYDSTGVHTRGYPLTPKRVLAVLRES